MRSLAKALGLVVGTALGNLACSSEKDEPADPGPTGTVTWCEVDVVLARKCRVCHVGQGRHGAPFPLVTFEDTQVDDSALERPRWQMMQRMVELDLMPPEDETVNPAPLSSEERRVLLTWFDEGAQAVGGADCP